MSFLSVAIEDIEGGKVEEVEYSQFLLLSDEQLRDVIGRFKDCKKSIFSESKLPTDAGRSRLRHYINDDSTSSYELTTKIHNGEAHSKDEYNVDIPLEVYRSMNTLATSQVLRIRISIPITKDGQAVIRSSGEPLVWELDVYVTANSIDSADAFMLSNWVKLELEVDKATLENVVEYIPFDYDKIILADSQEPEERAQISHLYDNVYNVLNKVSDDALNNLKSI